MVFWHVFGFFACFFKVFFNLKWKKVLVFGVEKWKSWCVWSVLEWKWHALISFLFFFGLNKWTSCWFFNGFEGFSTVQMPLGMRLNEKKNKQKKKEIKGQEF